MFISRCKKLNLTSRCSCSNLYSTSTTQVSGVGFLGTSYKIFPRQDAFTILNSKLLIQVITGITIITVIIATLFPTIIFHTHCILKIHMLKKYSCQMRKAYQMQLHVFKTAMWAQQLCTSYLLLVEKSYRKRELFLREGCLSSHVALL